MSRSLGPRQQEWLNKIREAGFAQWMNQLHAYGFIPGTQERIPNRVLFSLEDRGLVRRVRDERNQWRIVLVEVDDE